MFIELNKLNIMHKVQFGSINIMRKVTDTAEFRSNVK